ncbi:Dienelactone hydrolase endo--beta-d-glucanase [Mycena venus]|uniref:Dienelactone hydrolase endo--beta-d-glucanase n=1 Tax=Mycena venus TaxID=2733690 RepID=A0A8H6XPV1_9AGAR|nr:Dienelactone hydrolase endo--beta-d-glucanase [Mycena venus]
MSLCADCVKGVIHDGTPEGKLEVIDGVQCYIATPTCEYAKDKVLLYFTDAFGIPLVNNRLLADAFARNGFKTVIMDYHRGGSIPVGTMHRPSQGFDMDGWLANHTKADCRPPIDRVVAALKAEGVTKFGATGYCMGGYYVVQLALDNVICAGSAHHPSFLDVPGDLEKYAATSKAALLINSCETDWQFGPDAQAKADEIFANFEPGYKREYFVGCDHGFAVRGDVNVPIIKAGKEGAFKATVEWMRKYL